MTAVIAYIGLAARGNVASAKALSSEFLLFTAGLGLAALISMIGYLAQYCFTVAHNAVYLDYKHPYIHKKPAQKWLNSIGTFLQITAILAAFGSLVVFLLAVWRLLQTLSATPLA